MIIPKLTSLQGKISVPGDKSISHRSVMFGALARGKTRATHFLTGADCLSTISCFQKMGIEIERRDQEVIISGKGLHGLCAPSGLLDTGNSGTTTRLIAGILAAQPFESTLSGDESICRRPMKRILTPLAQMGARIESLHGNGCAPLKIHGGPLSGIHYDSPVASAQVKSCILLAGLYAKGITSVREPVLSRDHTERMLSAFGASLKREGNTVSIEPEPVLTGIEISVPGDISSAAYFIAAALLTPGSEVLIENVGINPTRAGMLKVCREMGADITLLNEKTGGEPSADLLVKSSALHGCTIGGEIIPSLIDELPMLAVMAAFAEGTTVISGASELKVKESDRIMTVCENLSRMGCDVTATEDGMIIRGGAPLHGAVLNSWLDHRIAMAFTVAGMLCEGEVEIQNADCVRISYPDFYHDLFSLGRQA